MIISTLVMASFLALWFYKTLIVAATGIVIPLAPMNMLVAAIICSAIAGDKVRRRLS